MSGENTLQTQGFLRLKQIIGPSGPIPVSRSTFYNWIASGKAPKPVKIGPRISAWPTDRINALIDQLKREEG